mmetsp:Transcript_29129/g.59612  ORF Transcript_29129/g.59612 Transcript_29129/m.59612 type:complete len:287 (-) Transcript_29129:2-862(-)
MARLPMGVEAMRSTAAPCCPGGIAVLPSRARARSCHFTVSRARLQLKSAWKVSSPITASPISPRADQGAEQEGATRLWGNTAYPAASCKRAATALNRVCVANSSPSPSRDELNARVGMPMASARRIKHATPLSSPPPPSSFSSVLASKKSRRAARFKSPLEAPPVFRARTAKSEETGCLSSPAEDGECFERKLAKAAKSTTAFSGLPGRSVEFRKMRSVRASVRSCSSAAALRWSVVFDARAAVALPRKAKLGKRPSSRRARLRSSGSNESTVMRWPFSAHIDGTS